MPAADIPALSALNVTLTYGAKPVAEGLTLTIPRGRFTALIGPNGSGKSTVLRALAGLMRPAAGEIRLGDTPLRGLSSRSLARRIGFLPQSPTAPEGLSVADLIRQGRYPHRSLFERMTAGDEAACARALQLTGLEGLARRPLDSLSGGQRQRAWIAMVLAQETDILLLDEPTTWLDIAHQIEVMALMETLVRQGGKTVVAVLHDLNQTARYAGHMVMLKAGRIIAEGPPARVMDPALIRAGFGVDCIVTPDPVTGTPMWSAQPWPGGNSAAETGAAALSRSC
ncbi:ABC transporter ATP-binding protein [Xinfangfangia sp. D13-10-4-6]|uniref:ABC transporter ATP-binding protein n=1 Tax=Pseudogemmobacter hezensis TaxID=2737662 RepID=UPI0015531376|nr:ABC transporter ATP-binding protein [Pseudogemmobacter hezensis]NPD17422.1 ABC transporter ATP-binding protein [Pseudogemmobacter hezensis]